MPELASLWSREHRSCLMSQTRPGSPSIQGSSLSCTQIHAYHSEYGTVTLMDVLSHDLGSPRFANAAKMFGSELSPRQSQDSFVFVLF